MSYLNFKSKYINKPDIKVSGFDGAVVSGYKEIVEKLKSLNLENKTLVFETYPQVNEQELLENIITPLNPKVIINSKNALITNSQFEDKMKDFITDDRVFGKMSQHMINDFIVDEKVEHLRSQLDAEGLKVIIGVGASKISEGDFIIYCDLTRWEIQSRYRNGASNWLSDNGHEDKLRKFKRGYFIEWRVADRLKVALKDKVDFVLDSNVLGEMKMISSGVYLEGLKQAVNKPFRLVPYFDSGVWGGQWMKEVCHLDHEKQNFAWSFDGVPEENSIRLKYGEDFIEVPAMNLVLFYPNELLGSNVFNRFGAEFPIRFDFLDTMKGQNLSLQVHPITSYIKEQFGMNYTQDESYYILDSVDDAVVYLGLKEGMDKEEMINDLRRAQEGEIKFPDEKYINQFPAKKHDHFSIPAGTIHCSGSGTMVLEISATPYIFTFKLWDWDRVGLDGLPRPVHIDHGEKVIQFDRTTKWVEDNLVSPVEVLNDSNVLEERTGLHALEFIETRRYTTKSEVTICTDNTFNMLNLVEGVEAIISSPTNEFEPYSVHYAETFIIPANVSKYTIKPATDVGEIKVLRAYVRSE